MAGYTPWPQQGNGNPNQCHAPLHFAMRQHRAGYNRKLSQLATQGNAVAFAVIMVVSMCSGAGKGAHVWTLPQRIDAWSTVASWNNDGDTWPQHQV